MKQIILAVAFDDENNTYSVDIPQGSSLNESAFAMSVVIKCFIKDGYIKDYTDVTKLIEKYCTDSQYDELTEENNGKTKEK